MNARPLSHWGLLRMDMSSCHQTWTNMSRNLTSEGCFGLFLHRLGLHDGVTWRISFLGMTMKQTGIAEVLSDHLLVDVLHVADGWRYLISVSVRRLAVTVWHHQMHWVYCWFFTGSLLFFHWFVPCFSLVQSLLVFILSIVFSLFQVSTDDFVTLKFQWCLMILSRTCTSIGRWC